MKSISFSININWMRIAISALLLTGMVLFKPVNSIHAQDSGWALEFDANSDMVILGEATDILGSGWQDTKSVSLWVKPMGDNLCTGPDVASCPLIFGDRPRFWGISIGLIPNGHDAGHDRIWIWNFDVSEKFIGIDYVPGEWVNIALVHSGGVLQAFKNGVERGSVASTTTTKPPPPSEPDLYIGGTTGGDVWLFHGQIDEVRLWNQALTGSEISQTMFETIPGDTPGLAAYYQMSDGQGTNLTDDSQFDHDGTLLDGNPQIPSDGTYPLWVISDAFVIPTPPSAPTGLSATAVSAFRVDLNWTDSSDNETDFEVERCTGEACSDFALFQTLPAGSQATTDSSTQAVTTYCYRVRAINSGGNSAYAGPECVTTPLVYLYMPVLRR